MSVSVVKGRVVCEQASKQSIGAQRRCDDQKGYLGHASWKLGHSFSVLAQAAPGHLQAGLSATGPMLSIDMTQQAR